MLVLTALALAQVSFSYDGWVTGPAGRLRLLALLLLLLAVGFVYYGEAPGVVRRSGRGPAPEQPALAAGAALALSD